MGGFAEEKVLPLPADGDERAQVVAPLEKAWMRTMDAFLISACSTTSHGTTRASLLEAMAGVRIDGKVEAPVTATPVSEPAAAAPA